MSTSTHGRPTPKAERSTVGRAGGGDGECLDLLERTEVLARRVIRLYAALPKTTEGPVIGKQLVRCGRSMGAQLREGERGRSDAEMLSTIERALQELDETVYRLELLGEPGTVDAGRLEDLHGEAHRLIAILVTSAETLERRRSKG